MVKVGIIGAGRIGKLHITSICTRVRNGVIKTVADPFMNEETAAWAESMGVQHTTTDYKEILNDPEIDAVLICSSTDTHSSISVEAINAGKHVFCEKPIDHDLAKIKEVVKALEGKDLKYMVGFNRRVDTHHAAVRQAIVDGKWDEYAGKIENLGIVSGDDPTLNYVQIPMESTQWNDTFTQDDYKALVASLASGEIQVSNDTSAEQPTAEKVAINFQGNIK